MNHYDSRYEEGLLGESTPDYERGLCRDQYDADDETSTVYYYHWWWYNYYHYCGVGPQVGVQKNEKIPAFDEEGGFDLSEVFFLNSKSDELSLDPEIQNAMSSPLEDSFENVVQGVILDGNNEYNLSDDFFLLRSKQSLDSESEADLMNVVHDVQNNGEVLNYYEEVQGAMTSPLEDIAQAVVQEIPNEDDQKVQHNQFILTDELGDFDFPARMSYASENVNQAIHQEVQHYEETRHSDDYECNLSDVLFMPRDELNENSFGENLDQFSGPEISPGSILQVETLPNLQINILWNTGGLSSRIPSYSELQSKMVVNNSRFDNCTTKNICDESDWTIIIIFHLIAIHNDHIVLPKTIR